MGASSPVQSPMSHPSRADFKAALIARAKAAAAEQDQEERGVRLPPIGPEARGRRCVSQPPAAASNASAGSASSRQRKPERQPRPQSLGPGGRPNDEEEKCGRQMFDKNTLRTNNRELFAPAIYQWRLQQCVIDGPQGVVEEESDVDAGGLVRVYVR